ncbi:hypothetical protein [Microcella flavibacter]|uniref:hypothetical protein n=1 Tax=Microcella flavibacter TaxID=1804990 RepID=UPI001457963D|nr:hypothetical protein [Microcella flavibacter]
MSTTPTPSEPRDEHDPTIAHDRDAAAGPSAATEQHGAPLIADEPRAEAEPEQPAAEPTASEPADDSRWAPPPVRPEPTPALVDPEPAPASLAADPTPDLVEPQPAAAPVAGSATEPRTTAGVDVPEHAPVVHGAERPAHEPTAPADTAVQQAAVQQDSAHETPAHETPAHETPAHEPAAVAASAATAAAAAPAAPTPTADASPQVVYVPAPTPPRKKGNRGMGVGIALAATPVFAVVYAAFALLFVAIAGGGIVASEAVDFFLTPSYYLPIVAFALFYVLLALIVNRAGWWAHVLGGFIVAALVYLVFIGSSLLTANALGAPAAQVQLFITQQLVNPIGWAAAIAAREVPIWVGGLVAKRGRTVKTRNVEAREAYERELAESRAARPAA